MSFSAFEKLLQSTTAHPIIDASIHSHKYVPLDLSVNNSQLESVDVSSSDDLGKFIWNHMDRHNATVAYGGYLEERGIYRISDYFNNIELNSERNIHLGLDIWTEAETPIYAPLNGKIHSFKNNINHRDYGPTIILEHQLNGFKFYTLYGHLSLASIQNLKVGVEVKQGEQIATLGTTEINGDYAPHLHFQIIKNMGNNEGDYRGVISKQEVGEYRNNCPDPNLLLKQHSAKTAYEVLP